MMAGVVPKRATSGRKQWSLHDGPRSSLKRLRSQMATDGCPESQVVLAKQLLDEQCGNENL
jgi:wolfamin